MGTLHPIDYIVWIKNITQIVFWAVGAIVAILTYRHARKTVLQPIRTEVFKVQLNAMSEIMGLFLGKHELSLRDAFDFRMLFLANFCSFVDAYAANFFDIQFDRETRLYNSKNCPIHFQDVDSPKKASTAYTRDVPITPPATPPDDRVRVARWAGYRQNRLYINRQFCDMEQHITTLRENPLLPLPLVDLLTNYLEVARRNQLNLQETLNAAVKEMPDKFGSIHELEQISSDWLWNQYMAKFEHLKPIADQIIEFIRKHFDVENLTQN